MSRRRVYTAGRLWTPLEAALILDTVFASRQYDIDATDPVAFKVLARSMDSDPEYLEAGGHLGSMAPGHDR